MKTKLKQLLHVSLLAMAVLLSPTSLYAQDTEIFFARAQADNVENQSIANVLIMVDTSGSMRFCENSEGGGGFTVNWCADSEERRIDILQSALEDMLETLPQGVRVGLGRYNYYRESNNSSSGQQGGRILVPVTDVNNASMPVFQTAIDSLNHARGIDGSEFLNNNYRYTGSEPAGDTPTGRAFAESARYMMGLPPVYHKALNGGAQSVCVAVGTQPVNCQTVFDGWGPWESVDWCDVLDGSCMVEFGDWEPSAGCDTASETCQANYGDWQPIAGSCDTSNETCQVEYGDWGNDSETACDVNLSTCRLGGWSNWDVTIASGANNGNCPTINTDTYRQERNTTWQQQGSGQVSVTECRERNRFYQTRTEGYFEREISFEEREANYSQREAQYREDCDVEHFCEEEAPIHSGGNFVSPMNLNNECETNHIVLFTDGAPSSNDKPGNQGFTNCGGKGSYACQEQIAEYLYRDDNHIGRHVKTYNIGLYMGNNQSNMESVSTDGVEGTVNADESEELVQAFSRIINLISDNTRTFASPGVAVNQMNRLEHLDQLYYAVFEPRNLSYWEGNLKRYRLVDGQIQDVSGPAIDTDTGFFAEGTRSFWSDEDDGADVRKGGARDNLEDRKLFYTDSSGDMHQLDWDDDDNPSLFGMPSDTSDTDIELIKTRLETLWGDPLHSEPVLVNYGDDSENNIIFVSGNAGMLHAVHSSSGEEAFSFMPHEMLQKAGEFTINRLPLDDGNKRQSFGLDSSWTAWRRPGTTSSSPPSKVYLFGGMRRGGTSYYALDVTDLDDPSLKWKIDRGDSGFERLGQTWSQPTLTQVKVNDNNVPALVFGGGYSPDNHDDKQGDGRNDFGDAMGNMLYVVNALTGDLIWSAGAQGSGGNHTTVNSMKWAVPSNISVVDANFDGVADFLYFGDLGGQIFRVDMNQSNVTNSNVRRLASLTAGNSAANNLRFFYPPSVGLVKNEETGAEKFWLTIGSGYRVHPLEEHTDDYFFAIRDDSVYRNAVSNDFVGSTPSLVQRAQLDEITDSSDADPDKQGWMLPLEQDGEKVLAQSVIFDGRAFFTSYMPGSDYDPSNPCVVRLGTSFIYSMDVVTAQSEIKDDNGDIIEDRKRELLQDVPPPSPTLISDGQQVHIIIGTEIASGEDVGFTGIRRGSWFPLEMGDPDVVPLPTEMPDWFGK